MKYVNVAVFAAIDNILTYSFPDNIPVKPGCRVVVPLGVKNTTGVIIEETKKLSIDLKKIRTIKEIVDPEPVLSKTMLKLGLWAADFYMSSPGIMYSSMLAALYKITTNTTVKLIVPPAESVKDEDVKTIIEYLDSKRGKKANIKDIEKSLKIKGIHSVMLKMKELELVETTEKTGGAGKRASLIEPGTGDKTARESIKLNKDQEKAFKDISGSIDKNAFDVFLLFGSTGSGKTEVYIRAAEKAISAGKQVIVMVPEIFLTPQIMEKFKSAFPGRTAVFHSGLKPAERFYEWKRMKSGDADIVVGTRSAVFAPFENAGLIIIDEEFDTSYKQESDPRYNARDTAVYRAKLEGAVVVLGSATPSMESYYNASKGKYKVLRLPERVMSRPMPDVKVIDLKFDKNRSRGLFLSNDMIKELRWSLEENEQAILFINRRGFSSYIMCRECGYDEKCGHCDVPLVYHRQGNVLKCHYCGRTKKPAVFCPACKKPLSYKGTGTQRIEEVIKKFFPDKKVTRVDLDAMKDGQDYFGVYSLIKEKKTDILVGTQMVAKGFDFPEVTFVGVVSIDAVLNIPDFRSGERAMQLLTQVAGRAGRGEKQGRVVIQTFHPDHPAVKYAKKHDPDSFFKEELIIREKLNYPPFGFLLQIISRDISEKTAEKTAKKTATNIQGFISKNNIKGIKVLGPAPAPIAKIRNRYRFSIIVKSRNRKELLALGRTLKKERGITVIMDPVNTL